MTERGVPGRGRRGARPGVLERAELAERLRKRRDEIEAALIARVRSLSPDPGEASGEYAMGLRRAAVAGVDYGIEAVETEDDPPAQIPEAITAQARHAARSGVGLDIILRRCLAGHSLLADFIVAEAESSLGPGQVKGLLQVLAGAIDRLLPEVTKAYADELARRRRGVAERKLERVRGLLAGRELHTEELAYDLDFHHLALVISGTGVPQALRSIGLALDCQVLSVELPDELTWAWLGARSPLDPGPIAKRIDEWAGGGRTISVGEPGAGITGWRRSHREALAAWPIARKRGRGIARYGEEALLAAAMHEELLIDSLRRLFLDPLRSPDEHLVQTLRAYLASERNASSTAASLGVSRRTVSHRLRSAEARIGRPISQVMSEIDLALRLKALGEDGSASGEPDVGTGRPTISS